MGWPLGGLFHAFFLVFLGRVCIEASAHILYLSYAVLDVTKKGFPRFELQSNHH